MMAPQERIVEIPDDEEQENQPVVMKNQMQVAKPDRQQRYIDDVEPIPGSLPGMKSRLDVPGRHGSLPSSPMLSPTTPSTVNINITSKQQKPGVASSSVMPFLMGAVAGAGGSSLLTGGVSGVVGDVASAALGVAGKVVKNVAQKASEMIGNRINDGTDESSQNQNRARANISTSSDLQANRGNNNNNNQNGLDAQGKPRTVSAYPNLNGKKKSIVAKQQQQANDSSTAGLLNNSYGDLERAQQRGNSAIEDILGEDNDGGQRRPNGFRQFVKARQDIVVSSSSASTKSLVKYFRFFNFLRALGTSSYGIYMGVKALNSPTYNQMGAYSFLMASLAFLILDLVLTFVRTFPKTLWPFWNVANYDPFERSWSALGLIADHELLIDITPLLVRNLRGFS